MVLLHLQLELLDLQGNPGINDQGAVMLLDCFKNIKALQLTDCNISPEMEQILQQRAMDEERYVSVGQFYNQQARYLQKKNITL